MKDFFSHLWSSKDEEMNFFIEYNSINAVVEYLNNGYVLNKEQNNTLRKVLLANNRHNSDVEELIHTGLPEQYIFYVLENLHIDIFVDKEQLDKVPVIKNWLLKKSDTHIAENLIFNWIEDCQSLMDDKVSLNDLNKKIEQLEKLNEYLVFLNESDINNLIDFVGDKLSNYYSKTLKRKKSDIDPQIVSLLKIIKESGYKKTEEKTVTKILNNLQNQEEKEIYKELELVSQKYETLIMDFDETDKIKKNDLLNLFNKYLLEGINQYLDIKKEIRTKRIKEKTAQEMILENIYAVKEVLDNYLKLANEEKLMKLSAKTEYFSQIKKQW